MRGASSLLANFSLRSSINYCTKRSLLTHKKGSVALPHDKGS
jgi:hypothetical protein